MYAEVEKVKRYNIGWAFLRIWMSFEVVLVHYWNQQDTTGDLFWIFQKMEMLAVPIFMLLAFILSEKTITGGTKNEILHRFYRLIWPYIFWAVVYWGSYNLCEIVFGGELVNGLQDLKWQLLLGSADNLNHPMWFQWDLIVLTAFFFLLCRGLKDRDNIVIYIIFFVALYLQYTNINGKLFTNYRNEIMYPIGRICEMIPYACIGILLSRQGWIDIFEKSTRKVIAVCSMSCVFLMSFEVFVLPSGYAYQGVSKLVLAVYLVVLFNLLPFCRLSEKVKKGILFISKYSLGVYCIHCLIGKLLNVYVYPKLGWNVNTFSECVVIYILSFLCSYLIAKIPCEKCRDIVS